MSQTTDERLRWTTADLELLPDNGNRYEIIDGELLVTRAPHWKHQKACGRLFAVLDAWSQSTALGEATINPGLFFQMLIMLSLMWFGLVMNASLSC